MHVECMHVKREGGEGGRNGGREKQRDKERVRQKERKICTHTPK